MDGPRALLFDTFGTVVDWRSGVAREASEFLRRYGRPGGAAEGEAFADAWCARYQPAMAAVRDGRRPFVLLDVLHREELPGVVGAFGLEPSAIELSDLDELTLAWHRLDPWPDAVAGLHRLRARFTIAPLSNGNVALLAAMAERAGLPWHRVLGAEVVRAYKPLPEAYARTAAALGLAPGQCLMVAAHNDDLRAAAGQGMRTAFVRRPREHGPGQRIDLAATGPWDLAVEDFGQLADALEC